MTVVAQPPVQHVRFPTAEGLGIFFGVVAWDVLSAGELNLVKASLIGIAGALVWYGARYWQASGRGRKS